MSQRDWVATAAFGACFFVLVLPVVGWYTNFVFQWNGSPYDTAGASDKIIVKVLGTGIDNFNLLSVFMAPIAVLIATRISATPGSVLIYIALPFVFAFLLAVVAPLTLTDAVKNNISTIVGVGDGTIWVTKAAESFNKYAETFASTTAVLLGLQLRGA